MSTHEKPDKTRQPSKMGCGDEGETALAVAYPNPKSDRLPRLGGNQRGAREPVPTVRDNLLPDFTRASARIGDNPYHELGRSLSPNGTKWHEYEISTGIGDKPCHQ